MSAANNIANLALIEIADDADHPPEDGDVMTWVDADEKTRFKPPEVRIAGGNEFSGAQSVYFVGITGHIDGVITVDAALSNNFRIALSSGQVTMGLPSNLRHGGRYLFKFYQPAGGGIDIGFDAGWLWRDDVAPTLDIAPGAVTFVEGIYDDIAEQFHARVLDAEPTVDGPDPVPPPVSYARNGLGVAWVENYDFICSAGDYVLQGAPLSAPQTPVTLSAADATHDRIDVFVVTSGGAWAVVEGTPATPAVKPDIDPESQLEITFCIVPAASTEPDFGTNTVQIYNEGTEWTDSRSGAPLNLTSSADPYLGTVSIEATATTTGNYLRFVAPGTINLADYNSLVLYIKSKAAWPSTRQLNVGWYDGNTQRGSLVPIRQGTFGFNSASTAAYQQIVIPLSSFVADGLPVNRLQITVGGTGATFGFFLDDIKLQGGLSALPSNALTWGGMWVSDKMYEARTVVNYLDGLYVTKRTNIAANPVTATDDWEEMIPPSNSLGFVESISGSGVDNTDPANPVITVVESVSAGSGITVDNTDPENPIVSLTASAGTELKGLTFTSDTDSTADSDPGNGLFKWNNGTQASATFLYFDASTADAVSLATFYASLGTTGFIYMQQADDSTKWQLWKWTAGPTDGTGYWKFPVTLQASGGSIADAKTVYCDFSGAGGGSGGGTIGRHMLPVRAAAMSPGTLNPCGTLLAQNVGVSATKPDVLYLPFSPSADEYAHFDIAMPESWDGGTITFQPIWKHPATTVNFGVVWVLAAVAVGDDDTLDVSFGTGQSSTDTGGTTGDLYIGPESSAITVAGSPAAGDTVFFLLRRDTANGSDTMAVDAHLIGIRLYYTTDAETD